MNHLYAAGETCCNGVHGANRLAISGIRCRAVADKLPAYAELEEPSLEDAYLYLIHQNAGEAAR